MQFEIYETFMGIHTFNIPRRPMKRSCTYAKAGYGCVGALNHVFKVVPSVGGIVL